MMRKIKMLFILAFFVVLLVPVVFMNYEKKAISKIDNRALAVNPFDTAKKGKPIPHKNFENYVSDRIGFRNESIRNYITWNEKLFGVLIHPNYEYGKNGEVFFRRMSGECESREGYYDVFAKAVVNMKNYCKTRGIPFIFMFEPLKNSVLKEQIPKGINYDNSWTKVLFEKLQKKGVVVVDNTKILTEKTRKGERVFNKKFDSGHWNMLGAFYGINNVLKEMKLSKPQICLNKFEDFSISKIKERYLLLSKFQIDEYVPEFVSKKKKEISILNLYGEVDVHKQHRYFNYFINNSMLKQEGIRVLVFQGSNINNSHYGAWSLFANAFKEYIAVHDYQNVLNLDYYVNLFNPDYVIFETAENSCRNEYYDYEKMRSLNLPGVLSDYDYFLTKKITGVDDIKVSKIIKKTTTVFCVENVPDTVRYVFLKTEREHDMHKVGKGKYTLTVRNCDDNMSNGVITFLDVKNKLRFSKSVNLNI